MRGLLSESAVTISTPTTTKLPLYRRCQLLVTGAQCASGFAWQGTTSAQHAAFTDAMEWQVAKSSSCCCATAHWHTESVLLAAVSAVGLKSTD